MRKGGFIYPVRSLFKWASVCSSDRQGYGFASAAQTALMFMEATKTPASALLGGEFRHGPLEMVGPGFICIIYAHSRSGVYRQSIRLMADVLSLMVK